MYDEDDYEHEPQDEPMPMPTASDVIAFRDAINRGRAAFDLEPVELFDFDACEPGSTTSCLSAMHFAALVGGTVGIHHFHFSDASAARIAAEVFNPSTPEWSGSVRIPEQIRRVTDVFDETAYGDDRWCRLRDAMVDAGVVE